MRGAAKRYTSIRRRVYLVLEGGHAGGPFGLVFLDPPYTKGAMDYAAVAREKERPSSTCRRTSSS